MKGAQPRRKSRKRPQIDVEREENAELEEAIERLRSMVLAMEIRAERAAERAKERPNHRATVEKAQALSTQWEAAIRLQREVVAMVALARAHVKLAEEIAAAGIRDAFRQMARVHGLDKARLRKAKKVPDGDPAEQEAMLIAMLLEAKKAAVFVHADRLRVEKGLAVTRLELEGLTKQLSGSQSAPEQARLRDRIMWLEEMSREGYQHLLTQTAATRRVSVALRELWHRIPAHLLPALQRAEAALTLSRPS